MSLETDFIEMSESKDERVLKSELKRTKDLQKKRFNTFSDVDDYNFDPNEIEIPACKKLCYDDDDDDDDKDVDLNGGKSTEFETPSCKKLCYGDDEDDENKTTIRDSGEFGKAIQEEKEALPAQTHKDIPSTAVKKVSFSLKDAGEEKPSAELHPKTPYNEITLTANAKRNAWFSEPTIRVTEPIKATVFVKKEPPKQHHTMMPPPPFPHPSQSSQTSSQQTSQLLPPPPTIKITPAAPEKKFLYPVPDLSGFDDDDDLPPASNSSATPQLIRATYTPSTPLKCPGTPTRTPTISRCQLPPMTVAHPSVYRKGYGNNGGKLTFTMDNLEVCGQIGEGSFGVVYKVRSVKNNQFYAMKVSNKPIPYTYSPMMPYNGGGGGGCGGGHSGNLFPPKPPLSDNSQSLGVPSASASMSAKSRRPSGSVSAMLRSGSGSGSGNVFGFMSRLNGIDGDSKSVGGNGHDHSIEHVFASVQHRIKANKVKNTVHIPPPPPPAAAAAKDLLKKPLSQTSQKSSIFGSIKLPSKKTIEPSNDNSNNNNSNSDSDSSDSNDDDDDFYLNESPLIRIGSGGGGNITITNTNNDDNNNKIENNNNDDNKNDKNGNNNNNYFGGRGGVFLNSEVERMMSIPYHPNILTVVQAWSESDRKIRILTDLCEKSLMKYLEELWAKDKGLSEEQILSFASDIFKGVHHLHLHKTMHLDLKPDNLLLYNGGKNVKVGDFGLAHRAGDKIIPSEGDNKYMAPELLSGSFGFPADIFSLGITLYEMSVPKIVIPGKGERWRALRNNDIDFSMWTHSEELKELIKWMLRADPKERPTSFDLVNHKLIKKSSVVVNKPLQ